METLETEPPKESPLLRKSLPKSKKKPLSKKKLAIINEKLSLLSQNLRLFPFVPNPKTLDSISAHEALFRSLNLWDFANLELDSQIHTELLTELIACYDPIKHHSLVNGLRINLSRADLGRALQLPSKNQKSGAIEFDAGEFGGGDAVATVLWGFISNRMVFLDDAAILPNQVVAANRLIKEGSPNKVDWAGLMWVLVEKEILEAPGNGSCYYASHLQCLMKYQKPMLFEEMAAGSSEAATVEQDVHVEEFGDVGSDKLGPGLSLGIGGDCEESKNEDLSKEEVEKGERVGEGFDNDLAEAKLPNVNYNAGTSQGEHLSKEEGERLECDEFGRGEENKGKGVEDGLNDDLAEAKFPTLDRLTSSDFMQVMDANNNLSFGLDQSNGDFLAMGSDMHNRGMGLDLGQASSSMFGNEHKRASQEIDDHVDGFHQIHRQKRFQTDQPWEQTPTVLGFDGLREEIQHVMGKARMDIVEKEQACMNAQEQVQYLSEVLQQKDEIIQSLESNRMEELQTRQNEECRFEHDLKTLSNILFGCKKALKDTQIAFAEYRKKFPLGNETICKEVGGTCDDVLNDSETEKPRSTEEEEMRQIARSMFNEFNKSWSEKFYKHTTWVATSATKLVKLTEEFQLLKERTAEAKNQHC